MSKEPTREELYERIRKSSREEVVLEEMIRLGFWPAQGQVPTDPADEIRRRGEIQRELSELRKENRTLFNEEALLKEYRKKRFEEALRKRKETKERRERERKERAEAWRLKKEQEIVFLGPGVSGGLNNLEGDEQKLKTQNLPLLFTADQIAKAMNIKIADLRFLAFSRKTSTTTHYVRFKIPKKTGGERLIDLSLLQCLD
jgi:RNA-directed DNA polymerase